MDPSHHSDGRLPITRVVISPFLTPYHPTSSYLTLSHPITLFHKVSPFLTLPHSISPYQPSHPISPYLAKAHNISSYLTVSHCLNISHTSTCPGGFSTHSPPVKSPCCSLPAGLHPHPQVGLTSNGSMKIDRGGPHHPDATGKVPYHHESELDDLGEPLSEPQAFEPQDVTFAQ